MANSQNSHYLPGPGSLELLASSLSLSPHPSELNLKSLTMSDLTPSLQGQSMSDHSQSLPDLASIPWFAHFMGLNDEGLVPTVTHTELMPSRWEMLEFWGQKSGAGFTFDYQGNEDYEVYIRNLFTRVMQLNWPVSGVVPFHFARSVVAEAKGIEINWAVFAYKQTHPHQSHTRIPRVLPEFTNITTPLENLVKILPFPGNEADPLSPTSAQTGVHRPNMPSDAAAVKFEPVDHPSRRLGDPPSSADQAFQTMTAAAFSGLSLLRPAIESAVKAARNDLYQSLHDTKCGVSALKSKLIEEKERLKYVNRKLSGKKASHARAREGYERAQEVCAAAARHNNIHSEDQDQTTFHKLFVQSYERLEKSWCQNVQEAETRKKRWEFKVQRQQAVIDKLVINLAEAEKNYNIDCARIDLNLKSLQAVLDLLKQV